MRASFPTSISKSGAALELHFADRARTTNDVDVGVAEACFREVEILLSTSIRGGTMNARIVGGTLLALGGIGFLLSGAAKLTGAEMMKQLFALFGLPFWFIYVVGIVEIASSILLITKWRVLGACGLAAVGLSASAEHLTHGQGAMAPVPFALALVVLAGTWLLAKPTVGRRSVSAD
jgi:hypothetical protein